MFYLFCLVVFCSVACCCALMCGYFNMFIKCSFLLCGGRAWDGLASLDVVFCLISLMLYMCFIYVYFYTPHYFDGASESITLKKLICLFVAVMGVLVSTSDYLSTLIFWEFLGVVSFFLIIFYGSYLSLRSSIVTLVSSRFGDVCLFFLIGTNLYMSHYSGLMILFFCLMVFTKSASYPFMSWLLEAMRAPTPVSSLVHSSTLVAAGVWFAMRYDFGGVLGSSSVVSMLLLLTIFITGLCCFFFFDLKKIVALSTCKNISWCVFYLLFGDTLLSLFQLLSHGVAKCLLFILVGDLMSGSGGAQSVNCVYGSRLYGKWGLFSLFLAVLGLSGVPFMGVFFTKHFLLSSLMGVGSVGLFLLVLLCVFLSYFYSFRMCSMLARLGGSVSTGVMHYYGFGGILLFWLGINFFVFFFLEEVQFLWVWSAVCMILFQAMSIIVGYYSYKSSGLSHWSSCLFGCDSLVESCYSMYVFIVDRVWLLYYRWDYYLLSLFVRGNLGNLGASNTLFMNLLIVFLLVSVAWFCWMVG